MKKTFFIYAITLLIFSESCWSMQRSLTQGLRFARTPLSRYSLPRELPPVTRFNSLTNTSDRFNLRNQNPRFSRLAAPTLPITSCLAMQDNERPDGYGDNDTNTPIEDLKKIFDKHKEFLEKNKIKPISTGQNIREWILEQIQNDNAIKNILVFAIYDAKYALVKEIINAMGDMIEQYNQLYQAVRDGDKKIKRLRELLKKGVNPEGYAFPNNNYTPLNFTKELYKKKNNKIHKNIYELLKEAGFEEESPLDIARNMQNYAAIELLFEYGATTRLWLY